VNTAAVRDFLSQMNDDLPKLYKALSVKRRVIFPSEAAEGPSAEQEKSPCW